VTAHGGLTLLEEHRTSNLAFVSPMELPSLKILPTEPCSSADGPLGQMTLRARVRVRVHVRVRAGVRDGGGTTTSGGSDGGGASS